MFLGKESQYHQVNLQIWFVYQLL